MKSIVIVYDKELEGREWAEASRMACGVELYVPDTLGIFGYTTLRGVFHVGIPLRATMIIGRPWAQPSGAGSSGVRVART